MSKRRAWPKTTKEIRLLIRVFGVLIALRLLLRWVKLTTLLRWLTPFGAYKTIAPETFEKAVKYTDGIVWRLPLSPKGNCLPRSLALYYFATRCGLPVCLSCGIRRTGKTLEGHAWLSLHGRPFLERGNPALGYTVTFSFPVSEMNVTG